MIYLVLKIDFEHRLKKNLNNSIENRMMASKQVKSTVNKGIESVSKNGGGRRLARS